MSLINTLYHRSWAERVEQELSKEWPKILSGIEATGEEEFAISAGILSRDFEATYHLKKQANLDDDSIGIYRLLDDNIVKLESPTIHFPFSNDTDNTTGEIAMRLDDIVDVRYLDIQGGATKTKTGDYYVGPHLIGEVLMGELIVEDGLLLPEGYSIGFIPFKDVVVAENHPFHNYN